MKLKLCLTISFAGLLAGCVQHADPCTSIASLMPLVPIPHYPARLVASERELSRWLVLYNRLQHNQARLLWKS